MKNQLSTIEEERHDFQYDTTLSMLKAYSTHHGRRFKRDGQTVNILHKASYPGTARNAGLEYWLTAFPDKKGVLRG